ncbi:MAG TPA: YegS/Rv2252/BmrU family lipid kinase [Flavisolibacter sp.]|jgi:diacylglycerol kinase (ATP)
MSIPKHIALVINPLHQTALRAGNEITQLLTQKNIEHRIFTTTWPLEWSDFTEVWIAGGDGTLNYFINHYPQFDLPMAIFKGGTGNDFHWMLYGELSLTEQVERVLNTTPKQVDAGYCNNHLFLNGIGIGFDGKVVQDLLGKRKWNGKLSYYKVVLKNIFFFSEFLCTISNETFNWGKKCFMINIANGRRYGGGFTVNPEGLINDRLLDINIIGNISSLQRFRFLKNIEDGTHITLPMVTYLKAGNIHIKTGKIVPAHADGEYFDASEFVIECLPGRFTFLY